MPPEDVEAPPPRVRLDALTARALLSHDGWAERLDDATYCARHDEFIAALPERVPPAWQPLTVTHT